MSIYLDIYIITNAIMNYITLLITKHITHSNSKNFKLIILSIMGALYSILMFFEKTKYFTGYIGKILFSYMIVRIAFKERNIKYRIINLVIFYVVSFVLGGCGLYIYNTFCINSNLFVVLFTTIIFSYFTISIVSWIYDKKTSIAKLTDEIVIYNDNEKVKLDCFYDTGNNLSDPFSKRPVILVNGNKIKKLELNNIRIIPFYSIGGSGHIKGYIPDKIIINNTQVDAVIGIIDDNISYCNKYDAIVNPNILNEYRGA